MNCAVLLFGVTRPLVDQTTSQSKVHFCSLYINMEVIPAPQKWSQNILIATLWLATEKEISPILSMLANGTWSKLQTQSTCQIHFSQRQFLSFRQFSSHWCLSKCLFCCLTWLKTLAPNDITQGDILASLLHSSRSSHPSLYTVNSSIRHLGVVSGVVIVSVIAFTS